jgi:hypothetical protein
MGILAALFLVVASSCGLLVAPALFLYRYHTSSDTWWTEVVKMPWVVLQLHSLPASLGSMFGS